MAAIFIYKFSCEAKVDKDWVKLAILVLFNYDVGKFEIVVDSMGGMHNF